MSHTAAPTVENLIEIYQHVLETDGIAADADFFDLGGDSLLATRVLSAVAREFDTELTFAEFLTAPTPKGVCELIAGVTA